MGIVIDGCGVWQELGNGEFEVVAWRDLVEVQIVTTGEGPFAEDVFFLLSGGDGTGCCVPNSDPESAALLKRLGMLPRFDHEKVIEAMGSTGNARFVCWKRA
jgi:hypothetical protein